MLIIRYTLEIYYIISLGHMVYATQSVSSSDFDCLFKQRLLLCPQFSYPDLNKKSLLLWPP